MRLTLLPKDQNYKSIFPKEKFNDDSTDSETDLVINGLELSVTAHILEQGSFLSIDNLAPFSDYVFANQPYKSSDWDRKIILNLFTGWVRGLKCFIKLMMINNFII